MSGPAHRSVSSIRPSITGLQAGTGSPQTPTRLPSSSFGSPSALRAEEECVVIELGNRFLRAGLAGDTFPKAVIAFSPSERRRIGDYQLFKAGLDTRCRGRINAINWGDDFTIWDIDLRSTDLALVGDKLERAVREALTKYLLVDSRPRKMVLAIPTGVPHDLLGTILDTLFNAFQAPSISLMSAPMLITASAGLRAALVVDIGWAETTVTAVTEFRELLCRRSIRAAKHLSLAFLNLLAVLMDLAMDERTSSSEEGWKDRGSNALRFIDFEEVEEIMERLAWCRGLKSSSGESSDALPIVHEEEEEVAHGLDRLHVSSDEDRVTSISLRTTSPPRDILVSYNQLAEPCESALLGNCNENAKWDDEELPLHELIYQSLLYLPVDTRSDCMSRIIFTGGVSKTPGLKHRVMDELRVLLQQRGWNPVAGKAVGQLSSNKRLRRTEQVNAGGLPVVRKDPEAEQDDNKSTNTAQESQTPDPIQERLQRNAKKGRIPEIKGILRMVDSLGAWSGASLLSQLRIPAVSIVGRDQWLQYGPAGAFKTGDLVSNTGQNMGIAALPKVGPGDRTPWTLGAWG